MLEVIHRETLEWLGVGGSMLAVAVWCGLHGLAPEDVLILDHIPVTDVFPEEQ